MVIGQAAFIYTEQPVEAETSLDVRMPGLTQVSLNACLTEYMMLPCLVVIQ